MKTVNLFCSRDNVTHEFELSVAAPLEFHAVGQCGHVLKFTAPNADELRRWIAAHNEGNGPAVTAAMVEEALSASQDILDAI